MSCWANLKEGFNYIKKSYVIKCEGQSQNAQRLAGISCGRGILKLMDFICLGFG